MAPDEVAGGWVVQVTAPMVPAPAWTLGRRQPASSLCSLLLPVAPVALLEGSAAQHLAGSQLCIGSGSRFPSCGEQRVSRLWAKLLGSAGRARISLAHPWPAGWDFRGEGCWVDAVLQAAGSPGGEVCFQEQKEERGTWWSLPWAGGLQHGPPGPPTQPPAQLRGARRA